MPLIQGDESSSAHNANGTAQLGLAYDRTHLANERTYAAWLRTGLAVAAGGIAVAHLVPEPSRDSLIALALGASFVVLGVGVMFYGAHQFATMTRYLSLTNDRPGPASGRAIYALTTLIGALLLAVLVFLWTHQGRTNVSSREQPSRHRVSMQHATTRDVNVPNARCERA